MSPVDPISPRPSPTSSMDISPTSAIEAGLMIPMLSPRLPFVAAMPSTPILAATDSLPRLITTFQNSNHRRVSSELQFALLTPSPLALRSGSLSGTSSPKTAILVPESGRTFSIQYGCSLNSPATTRSPTKLSSNGSGGHRRTCIDGSSAEHIAHPPTLQRQNAMEGLEKMEVDEDLTTMTPTVVTKLPIRLSAKQPSDCDSLSANPSQSLPTVPALMRDALPMKMTIRKSTRKHTRSPAISKSVPLPPRCTSSSSLVEQSPRSRAPSRSKSQVRKRHHRRTITRPPTPILNIVARSHIQQVSKERSQKQAQFEALLTHLSHPLVPLVSVKTGKSHPDFPRTLLSYKLLTHDQLDSLARHYHQTIDAGEERWLYPAPIGWGKVWCGSESGSGSYIESNGKCDCNDVATKRHLASLEVKRRRWGRFIGLRGCESPVAGTFAVAGDGERQQQEQEEDIVERMERQWREALRRAEEEKNVREKLWGRRF